MKTVVLSFMLGVTCCLLLCGYVTSVCEYAGKPASETIFFMFVVSLLITWLVTVANLFSTVKRR